MVDPPAVVAPIPTTHGTGAAATPGGAKAAKKAVRPPGGGAGGSPGDAALVTSAARAAAPHVAVTGSTGRRDENANPQSLFGTDLVLPQFGAFSANGDAAFPHDRQADKRARRRNDTRVLFAAGAGGGAKNRSRPRGFPTCGCSGGCSKDTCLGRGISMQQHSVRYVAQHTYAALFHEGDVVSCRLRSGDPVQRGEILKRRPATGSNEPMYKVAIPPTAEVGNGESQTVVRNMPRSRLERIGPVKPMPRNLREGLARITDLNIAGANEATFRDNAALRLYEQQRQERKRNADDAAAKVPCAPPPPPPPPPLNGSQKISPPKKFK